VAPMDGHLRWDLTGLYAEVLTGLRELGRRFPTVESIGIDTWAVDYGLLDADGRLLAEPVSYRDSRTDAVLDEVHRAISREQLYAVNGLQFLPFTTVYQLAAERRKPLWDKTEHVVLLPDLLAFWLTGSLATEVTNASTTGLLDLRTGTWSPDVLAVLGLPERKLPALQHPGDVRGTLLPGVLATTGLPATTVVTTVGSHDTASAVVAVPATDPHFAYVSSGTWSLVGVELDKPVVTVDSQRENFTNEGGVDGRTRFLRNVGGLWLLQESLREWRARGLALDLDSVLTEAETLPAGGPTVDVDDDGFIPPGGMPERITAAVERTGRTPPTTPAAVVRCILDSLAAAYAGTARRAGELAGQEVDRIHVVGGGSQNRLLCQLTADLSGIAVTGGPVEATALGNVLVQARAHGAAPGTLEELRAALARTQDLRTFRPA
jgi:rhamnulokinase